ncbi:polyheme membrane-associated cytochrome C [Limimaricola pyoseonensis]|uniref:Uncharacterized protein n=1 Tax=Limimaricola pyoseonensis TaxID=521013 RepID=A0A1G7JMQ9_9RHOB|nr:polyheme membrane-associated cytochrome C [Limimaricola pyoseonensis]SDF26064.1 hypothetical protein SAMN04488567_3783 [Limimaricola pyoseonensis]
MSRLTITVIVIAAGGLGSPPAAQDAAPSPEQIVSDWLGSAHAKTAAEAFRHWDAEGEIPGHCAVCHSTPGFVAYANGPRQSPGRIDHPVPTGSLVECESCHDPAVSRIEEVLFPSGDTASFGTSTACAICHQGRAWGGDVDAATANMPPDEVVPELSFINVHYSAAATTQMGSEVAGGYEYPDRDYAGRFNHVPGLESCVGCHGPHDTSLEIADCTDCHAGIRAFDDIRTTAQDLDGDGTADTGIGHELAALHDRLGAAITRYAAEISDRPILYDPAAYPYFFADLDGDGIGDEDELQRGNAYAAWTPRLLRAAYNYQFVAKDHGAYAHNPHYAAQLVIDSLADLSSVLAEELEVERP